MVNEWINNGVLFITSASDKSFFNRYRPQRATMQVADLRLKYRNRSIVEMSGLPPQKANSRLFRG